MHPEVAHYNKKKTLFKQETETEKETPSHSYHIFHYFHENGQGGRLLKKRPP